MSEPIKDFALDDYLIPPMTFLGFSEELPPDDLKHPDQPWVRIIEIGAAKDTGNEDE